MAKLVYDETGRLLFTKEMKEEYTILMPQMLPIHFGMFRQMLELEGYHVAQLNNCLLYTSRPTVRWVFPGGWKSCAAAPKPR